jgi:hypothetical protein
MPVTIAAFLGVPSHAVAGAAAGTPVIGGQAVAIRIEDAMPVRPQRRPR